MAVTFGNLDALVGFSFDSTNCNGLSVQSAATSGSGSSETVSTLTGDVNGSSLEFPTGSGTFTIVSVSDTSNTITTTGVLADGTKIPAQTWTLIGLSSGSFLMTSLSMSTFAQGVDTLPASSLNTFVIAVSPVAPADDTPITFTPASTFDNTACFTLGTHILTVRGEVVVEALRVGDRVPTLVSGEFAAVRWIGRRTVRIARHPRPWDVAPVRVHAGAFGPRQPHRDLLLSPDHAVRAGDVLIPVRYLLNGATIVQETVQSVTYLHVELAAHDVLLAEGLPCESYLDTGNRDAFANGGGAVKLAVDFSRAAWAERGCLPLVLEGAPVVAAKRRLLDRAKALGWRRTRHPMLRVLADGRPVGTVRSGAAWHVPLPPKTRQVRLLSRAAVPGELCADATDGRRLGVALAALHLDGTPPPDTCFGSGWHAPEDGWRWTDGDAELLTGDARTFGFSLVMAETYWRDPPARQPEWRPGARVA